ncbi:hypothetical protein 33D_0068 [Mycobacterium phage 33D]|nr:hypothetical protein 33D_0068 [Mycobacterium phage 33D]
MASTSVPGPVVVALDEGGQQGALTHPDNRPRQGVAIAH